MCVCVCVCVCVWTRLAARNISYGHWPKVSNQTPTYGIHPIKKLLIKFMFSLQLSWIRPSDLFRIRLHAFKSGRYENAYKILVTKSERQESVYLSGTALGYGLDDRWFESRQRLRAFLFTTVSRPALGPTQPPMKWIPGFLSLGVKRPWREADYSPPSRAKVNNAWRYTSIPPIRLHGVVLG
jgi:hypothetical protein